MKKILLLLLLFVVSAYSQNRTGAGYTDAYKRVETRQLINDSLDVHDTQLRSEMPDSAITVWVDSVGVLEARMQVDWLQSINDSTAFKKVSDRPTFIKTAADSMLVGVDSLTELYNNHDGAKYASQHQSRSEIGSGLTILGNTLSGGYSILNMTFPVTPARGSGIINFNSISKVDGKPKPLYFIGVDLVAKLAQPDSVPPFFIMFGAYDSAGVNNANDMMGVVGNNYTTSGGTKHYRGEWFFNSMGLSNAVFNIATRGATASGGGHPSGFSILRLHRVDEDSTQNWLKFSHNSTGLSTFQMTYNGDMKWYNPTTGSSSYLTGDGFSFVFTSNNNLLEMQGGGLTMRGGGLTVLPNKNTWNYNILTLTTDNTNTTVFSGYGIKTTVLDSTHGNFFSWSNYNINGSRNATIDMINIGSPYTEYKGAIRFTTRSASGEYGERLRINEFGHVEFPQLGVSNGATTATATQDGEIVMYAKAGKLIFAHNDGGTMKYWYLDVTATADTLVYTTSAP